MPAPATTREDIRFHVPDERLSALLRLLDTPAPSGYEQPAVAAYLDIAREFADVRTDRLGNAYATVNAGAGPVVLLAGHLDEIGFVVTKAEASGVLRFSGIGGWDASVPIGQRVRVLTSDVAVPGIVGRQPTHTLTGDEKPKLNDLWIDIGAVDEQDALARVRVGDPIVIDATPLRLGDHLVASRSADDRVGAWVALETARRCAGLAVEVVAVGTITEETCQIGALTAAYDVAPWRAMAIDVTFTSDIPGDHDNDVEVGKGPAVTFGAAARASVGSQLVRTARRHDIPLQLEAAGRATHTDADEIVRAGAGVVSGLVSIPTRYLHTPCELFDLRDAQATVELLVAWIRDECAGGGNAGN